MQRNLQSSFFIYLTEQLRAFHKGPAVAVWWHWYLSPPSSNRQSNTLTPDPPLSLSSRTGVTQHQGFCSIVPRLRAWSPVRSPAAGWNPNKSKFGVLLVESAYGLLSLVHHSNTSQSRLSVSLCMCKEKDSAFPYTALWHSWWGSSGWVGWSSDQVVVRQVSNVWFKAWRMTPSVHSRESAY